MTEQDLFDNIYDKVSLAALNARFASSLKCKGACSTATCVITMDCETSVPVVREELSSMQNPDIAGGVRAGMDDPDNCDQSNMFGYASDCETLACLNCSVCGTCDQSSMLEHASDRDSVLNAVSTTDETIARKLVDVDKF